MEATRFSIARKPVPWLSGFGSNSLAWMALKLPAMSAMMKTPAAKAKQMDEARDQGHGGNEWMVQEAVLPALARTIAHSQGERALMVCLARQADFSEMMSLAAHPEAKHGLALRLRTLCRQALPLGSTLHRKLCWQLLVHREQKVRNHIVRLVRYDGQSIWWAGGGREASEIIGESTERGRDRHHWAECTCDPLREIVEGEMLPCLSKVLSQEELRRWLLPLRKMIWICRCGSFYHHLWIEALFLVHQQRRALRKYLRHVYSRLPDREARPGGHEASGRVAATRRDWQVLGA